MLKKTPSYLISIFFWKEQRIKRKKLTRKMFIGMPSPNRSRMLKLYCVVKEHTTSINPHRKWLLRETSTYPFWPVATLTCCHLRIKSLKMFKYYSINTNKLDGYTNAYWRSHQTKNMKVVTSAWRNDMSLSLRCVCFKICGKGQHTLRNIRWRGR